MKTKLFLCVVLACFAFASQAQSTDVLPPNEDIYVLDGTNRSFAWGIHVAPNKIAIGLTDEGVYEIRNNNAIWLIDSPFTEDRQVADITTDNQTGRLLFTYHIPEEYRFPDMPVDTIGGYNPANREIYDKEYNNPIASVSNDGTVVSAKDRKALVSVNAKTSDKVLSAFFVLHHCLPQKKLRVKN